MSRPLWGNSRVPWPTTTRATSGFISSTRSFLSATRSSAAAVHLQLTGRLGFQLADGRCEVTGEDGRVRPLRIGERGRCHVLGPGVQASAMGLLPGTITPQ